MDDKSLGMAQYYMVEWTHTNSFEMTKRTGNVLNMSTVSLQFTFQVAPTAKSQQNAYTLEINFLPFMAFAKPSI